MSSYEGRHSTPFLHNGQAHATPTSRSHLRYTHAKIHIFSARQRAQVLFMRNTNLTEQPKTKMPSIDNRNTRHFQKAIPHGQPLPERFIVYHQPWPLTSFSASPTRRACRRNRTVSSWLRPSARLYFQCRRGSKRRHCRHARSRGNPGPPVGDRRSNPPD